jgi:hypothetical protein
MAASSGSRHGSLRIMLANVVRSIREILRRPPSEAKLHCSKWRKAAIGIGCQLAALGLSKIFQHGGKVRGVDFLGIAPLPLRLSMASAPPWQASARLLLMVR